MTVLRLNTLGSYRTVYKLQYSICIICSTVFALSATMFSFSRHSFKLLFGVSAIPRKLYKGIRSSAPPLGHMDASVGVPYAHVLSSATAGQRGMQRKRKREQVGSACDECRKQKAKCNKSRPCKRCLKVGARCSDIKSKAQLAPTNLAQSMETVAAGRRDTLSGISARDGRVAQGFSMTAAAAVAVCAVEAGGSLLGSKGGGQRTERAVASMAWHEVVEWLRGIDLDHKVLDVVAAEKVSGKQLVSMSLEDLMNDLHATKLQAKRVLLHLASRQGNPTEEAAKDTVASKTAGQALPRLLSSSSSVMLTSIFAGSELPRDSLAIEVNKEDWRMVTIGEGAAEFFKASPFGPMHGQVLPNFVHPQSVPTLLKLCTSLGRRGCSAVREIRVMHFIHQFSPGDQSAHEHHLSSNGGKDEGGSECSRADFPNFAEQDWVAAAEEDKVGLLVVDFELGEGILLGARRP